jgi:hypothetical protein
MAFMSTMPGFSSRSSVHLIKQFPHRDEAAMSEHEPEPGFSNSEPVEDAAQDVMPDVQTPEEPDPGFSNAKAVKNDDAPAADEDAADESKDEAPAKPAAKKSAAKKKG